MVALLCAGFDETPPSRYHRAIMLRSLPAPLESERLVVRTVERGDLAAVAAINSDPIVARYLPYAVWSGMDDAQAWYERVLGYHREGSAAQLVIEREQHGVIGTVVLFRFDAASQRVELGYALGKEWWGCGYMREALERVLRFVFDEGGARRVEAFMDPRNRASGALLERLGFRHEGTLREHTRIHDACVDSAIYGLLKHEWKERP